MPIKGRVVIDELLCKGCELCISSCPQHVLALANERLTAKGYHPAELVGSGCTGCAVCAVVCPEVAITVFRNVSRQKEQGG